MKTKFILKNSEIEKLLHAKPYEFPKYSRQILNLANQNAGATRPKIVGQMSELIQQFSGKTIEEWERWYLDRYPNAIKEASSKIADMIENFRNVMDHIDKELIEAWVKDLIIVKTFIGLGFKR